MQLQEAHCCEFEDVIAEICDLNWSALSEAQLRTVAWSYYFFSIQFRENLLIARSLLPDDPKLKMLEREECNTDNLSPFPGVALAGERMNHDEFMRRLLCLAPTSGEELHSFNTIGQQYLGTISGLDPIARALSIPSYEDGGLARVFQSILQAPAFETELSHSPLLRAFRFFLVEHINLDSDPELGHGALSRQLVPDDRILPVWEAFKTLFVGFTPALRTQPAFASLGSTFGDQEVVALDFGERVGSLTPELRADIVHAMEVGGTAVLSDVRP
jgi:hypothetical protein